MKIVLKAGAKKLYKDKVENDVNTTDGIIRKEEFNKTAKGVIKTHKGEPLVVAEPNFKDLFDNIKRGPQIITLKDAGMIVAELGLMKGYKVVDCGGGSGGLACVMANVVGPEGKVYVYDKEKKWCSIIERNAELFGFKNVDVECGDVSTIEKKNVDAFNLDLPNPWEAVTIVEKCLKNGGMLTVYVPNTTQLTTMEESAKNSSLVLLSVKELILREWSVNGKVCHPKFNMLGHTGFVMVYRKVDAK